MIIYHKQLRVLRFKLDDNEKAGITSMPSIVGCSLRYSESDAAVFIMTLLHLKPSWRQHIINSKERLPQEMLG